MEDVEKWATVKTRKTVSQKDQLSANQFECSAIKGSGKKRLWPVRTDPIIKSMRVLRRTWRKFSWCYNSRGVKNNKSKCDVAWTGIKRNYGVNRGRNLRHGKGPVQGKKTAQQCKKRQSLRTPLTTGGLKIWLENSRVFSKKVQQSNMHVLPSFIQVSPQHLKESVVCSYMFLHLMDFSSWFSSLVDKSVGEGNCYCYCCCQSTEPWNLKVCKYACVFVYVCTCVCIYCVYVSICV